MMMSAKALNLIPSGIEPVDKLLGGLEGGQTYLAHGDASGKSLFGIKFLIEGLKRGEPGALVIRYSHEDAVRRFARLGYDCLHDVQQGRLVILEYSDDIITQIKRLPELTPILRELEWVLGESRPGRIIFDPVTQLLAGEKGDLAARAREFTEWTSSFNATVLLVGSSDGKDKAIIEQLRPLVRESFRFDVAEKGERATRLFAFEKSRAVPDQSIEVDPTRGIFLLGRPSPPADKSNHHEANALHIAGRSRASSAPDAGDAPVVAPQIVTSSPLIEERSIEIGSGEVRTKAKNHADLTPPVAADRVEFARGGQILELDDVGLGEPHRLSAPQANFAPVQVSVGLSPLTITPPPALVPDDLPAQTRAASQEIDVKSASASNTDFNDFLEELEAAIAAIDLREDGQENHRGDSRESLSAGAVTTPATDYAKRASDAVAKPRQETIWQSSDSLSVTQGEQAVNPKDFTIVIVDEDPASRGRLAQTLGDYRLEPVEDILTGIARIMTSDPDLVILDMDMPIVDGFKVLAQLRASLSAPIILVSKTHVRAGDRVYSAELGADYYLTKPFSPKELKQKARQLIARYRGINSWIMAPTHTGNPYKVAAAEPSPRTELAEIVNIFPERRANFSRALSRSKKYQIEPYEQFIAQVDANVKTAVEKGLAFSVVGCRIESGTRNADREAVQFFKHISPLVRVSDVISTNPQNELVILLPETDAKGARAFIRRLLAEISDDLRLNLSVWMRSFPTMEEEKEILGASA